MNTLEQREFPLFYVLFEVNVYWARLLALYLKRQLSFGILLSENCSSTIILLFSMFFERCALYGIKTIGKLEELLNEDLLCFQNSSTLWRLYNIRLIDGHRIIESPRSDIKSVQRKILNNLYDIPIPDYIFSAPNKSVKDAVWLHKNTSTHVIKTDISKFFLSTGREKIFSFWFYEMNMESSVANIMTNLTTMDLRKCTLHEVTEFIEENNLCISHLGIGFPTSNALAYLCNYKMYEELFSYCESRGLLMSSFVDDLVFSSEQPVSMEIFKEIKAIINRHGYKVNIKKTKIMNNTKPKEVLGLLLFNGKILVPNKKHLEMYEKKRKLKMNGEDKKTKRSYLGLLNYIKNSEIQ